jgi:4-amino-4-deoxy-L-arabinose transferase-like glycosyltransferase
MHETKSASIRSGLAPLFLLLLSSAIYVGTAATPALLDEADCGHATAARELLATGDWTILHIDGVRWLEKPPLLFWLGAASYAMLGENAFSARLPVALATIALVLLIYEFGRRWFGKSAGFYAGLILSTSFGVFLFTRTMIAESLYALEFTAIFYLFLRGWEGSLRLRPAWWAAAVIAALAVLTRGLVGLILPATVVLLFLILTGGWSTLVPWRHPKSRRLPLLSSALIFLAVAAPWHILAGQRVPGFYWFYFVNEHFLRAMNRAATLDYTPVPRLLWWAEHLVWLFPWTLFAFYALKELPHPAAWQTRGPHASGEAVRLRQGYVEPRLLLFLWAGVILFFFTITTRLEYYSFGAWPAIALLIGIGLARAEKERLPSLSWVQGTLAALGALFAALLAAVLWHTRAIGSGADISPLLHTRAEENYRHALSVVGDMSLTTFAALRWELAAGAVIFSMGFGSAWLLRRRGQSLPATLATALTAAALLFVTHSGFVAFEPYLSSRALAQAIQQRFQPGDRIVLYGDFYGGCSVSFYTNQELWIWNGRYYGLAFGSNFPDAPKIFLDDGQFAALWASPQEVFLVVPATHRSEALKRLSPDRTFPFTQGGGKSVYVNHPLPNLRGPTVGAVLQPGASTVGRASSVTGR